MRYLFLDTASSRIIITYIKDSKIIFNVNEKNDNNLSNRLMNLIDENFKRCNINVNEIDKILVVNGPGSFTGIRCGVTVAKTLAFLLNIEIACVSELEVMASGYNEKVCPVIDARRGYVYTGIYDGINNLNDDKYVLYEEVLKTFNGKIVSYEYDDAFEPSIDIFKIIEKHKDESINPHMVVPNYLKKTEAEENLNAKVNQ